MAERRMFAKTIIDSDAFLDMPLSSQALYFHLSMRADDEGFINNPKKIQRMIGASDDDLKVLIAKSFIITFDTGIIVIKHWKIHNYIRGDRLQETKYKEERQMLSVKENGVYTFTEDSLITSATEKRRIAFKDSELPYSFTYKIRRAFDGKTCPVCGKKMSSSYRITTPTIQHNVPISKGGKHELNNISVICESCNASIRDEETGALNNDEVVSTWKRIIVAEEQNIDWFYHPDLLENVDDSQVTVISPSDVSIGKDRLGKERIDKDRLGNTPPLPPSRGRETPIEMFDRLALGRNISGPLKDKLHEWIEYKQERRESYKERGLKAFITWIESQEQIYGSSALIECITLSMAKGYKGIITDLINKKPERHTESVLERIARA